MDWGDDYGASGGISLVSLWLLPTVTGGKQQTRNDTPSVANTLGPCKHCRPADDKLAAARFTLPRGLHMYDAINC